MNRVAIIATFPGRAGTLNQALLSIAAQVDQTFVVLNEYPRIPEGHFPGNVQFVIPEEDLKDTGKFFVAVQPDDFVFLCDDDILYPADYAAALCAKWDAYQHLNPVVGVHGIIYSDFFDGDPQARIVHVFHDRLQTDPFVNQLGTGTILCRGSQLPPFAFMRSSARFVDVRFARHCAERGFPRICVAREHEWLKQLPVQSSIFETFTTGWDLSVVREVQSFGGFRFLPRLP